MISREDYKKDIYTIDELYDSIGSCGECRFSRSYSNTEIDCDINFLIRSKEWYCKDFERREDGIS